MKIKDALNKLLQYLFTRKQAANNIINPNEVQKILIVRLDKRIGNLVILTPLIKAVKENYPNAVVSLFINDSFKNIFDNFEYVDNIYLFRKRISLHN